MSPMAEKIVEVVRTYGHVSFVELERHVEPRWLPVTFSLKDEARR